MTDVDPRETLEWSLALRSVIEREGAQGFKLSVLPFLLQACAAALKEFPEFNAAQVAILGVSRAATKPVWDRALPDAPPLPVLRPPRDQRRRRGEVHHLPGRVLGDIRELLL